MYYEQGGWFEQAAKVARKIGDEGLAKSLECQK